MEAVNVHIGPLVFDHADYDAEGEETPEGHVLRFEPGTEHIVGLTVMNARWVLDRDGRLIVTIPGKVEASADELAPALTLA